MKPGFSESMYEGGPRLSQMLPVGLECSSGQASIPSFSFPLTVVLVSPLAGLHCLCLRHAGRAWRTLDGGAACVDGERGWMSLCSCFLIVFRA